MTILITHPNPVYLCIQMMCLVWSRYSWNAEKMSKTRRGSEKVQLGRVLASQAWWPGFYLWSPMVEERNWLKELSSDLHIWLTHTAINQYQSINHQWINRLYNLASNIELYVYMHVYFCFHSGTLIVLKHPYPRKVEEPSIYESVRVHTAMQTGRTENDLVPTAPSVSIHHAYHWMPSHMARIKAHELRWTFQLGQNPVAYAHNPSSWNSELESCYEFKPGLNRGFLVSQSCLVASCPVLKSHQTNNNTVYSRGCIKLGK